MGFPGSLAGKETTSSAGDPSSFPRSERSLGRGNSYPLQYPGQETSIDCIVHGIAESDTTERLSLLSHICMSMSNICFSLPLIFLISARHN